MYITLTQAKEQLNIDDGLTIHDARITDLIGAAEDWAENFTNRSLGQLVEFSSPADSPVTALPNPVNSPTPGAWRDFSAYEGDWGGGYDWSVSLSNWSNSMWDQYYAVNPIASDYSQPLRRDVKAAILIYLETLFDKDVANMKLLEQRATDMLWPYRLALGV